MILQAIGILTTSAVALTVWASQDDGGPTRVQPKETRVSVRALANRIEHPPFVRESEREPVKPAVRYLANARSPVERRTEEAEFAGGSDVNAPERTRVVMQRADVRGDVVNDPLLRQRKLAGLPGERLVPAGDRAMGRDVSPVTGLPWGWGGHGLHGFHWSRIAGYRSFASPFGTGGPHHFGHTCFVPGCCRFGFPPVAVGISGPVTIYYDEPLRRQWRLVDEGMRNLAAGAGRNP